MIPMEVHSHIDVDNVAKFKWSAGRIRHELDAENPSQAGYLPQHPVPGITYIILSNPWAAKLHQVHLWSADPGLGGPRPQHAFQGFILIPHHDIRWGTGYVLLVGGFCPLPNYHHHCMIIMGQAAAGAGVIGDAQCVHQIAKVHNNIEILMPASSGL